MDDELRKHPYLPLALRWLRHRAALRQEDVSEKVSDTGGKLSTVFYRKLESTSPNEESRRYPSAETLGQLLAALDSNPLQLKLLLDSPPWETEPEERVNYRVTNFTPKPLLRSASRALSPDGMNFLSKSHMAPSGDASFISAQSLDHFGSAESMMLNSLGADLIGDAQAPVNQAFLDAQEIATGYPQLPAGDRATLLGHYRALRARNKL